MNPLSLFLKIKSRHVATAELFVVIVLVIYAWTATQKMKTQRAELQAAETALKNPKTVEVVKIVRVTGPVRVITKVVERPGGEREITTETTRGEGVETIGSEATKTPVPLNSIANALPKRQNRVLMGLDLENLNPREINSYAVYGGYSWLNRLDLLLGVSKRRDWESHVMVVGRF